MLVGLRAWVGTYSLFPLRAKPALPLEQVKAKVFDSVLANVASFLETLPPIKEKGGGVDFHIVLMSWSNQQEVI
jgi:hypothetical protein